MQKLFNKLFIIFFIFGAMCLSFTNILCMKDNQKKQEACVKKSNSGFGLVKKFKLPVKRVRRVVIDKVNNRVAFVSIGKIKGCLVQVWSMGNKDEKEALVFKYKHEAGVWGLDFSQNGKYLVSVSEDGYVMVVRLSDKKIVVDKIKLGFDVGSLPKNLKNKINVLFSPDNKYLAISFFRSALCLYNLDSGKVKKYNIKYPIVNFEFSPNSRWLAIVSSDKVNWLKGFNYRADLLDIEKDTVKELFDFKHSSCAMHMYKIFRRKGYLLNFSPDNKYLAVSRILDGLFIYDLESKLKRTGGHWGYWGKRILFSDNGKKIFYDSDLEVCHLHKMKKILGGDILKISINAHTCGGLKASCFLCTPDGRYLLKEGFCNKEDEMFLFNSYKVGNEEKIKRERGLSFLVADFDRRYPDKNKVYSFKYNDGYRRDPKFRSLEFSHDYKYILSVLSDGQVYMHKTSNELYSSVNTYLIKARKKEIEKKDEKYKKLDELDRIESIKNNDFKTFNFPVKLRYKKLKGLKSLF